MFMYSDLFSCECGFDNSVGEKTLNIGYVSFVLEHGPYDLEQLEQLTARSSKRQIKVQRF